MLCYKCRFYLVFLFVLVFVVNKVVGNLELEFFNVKLYIICRGNDIVLDVNENMFLLELDIVVLSGE